jgi:MoaA/NifB/PqqE/SkfB family radical SAM enzyme
LGRIIRAIRASGMQATMTTGGRGMTRERAAAGARAGLQSASVSIDGTEATHDRLRGVPDLIARRSTRFRTCARPASGGS